MTSEYTGQRYVLRSHPGSAEAEQIAGRRGWRALGVSPADSTRGTPPEVRWNIEAGCDFSYAQDDVGGCGYVYVGGRHQDPVERYSREVAREPEVFSSEELLYMVRTAAQTSERGAALVRLGVAAPRYFDGSIFEAIAGGLRDPDPKIRGVALRACSYSPGGEYEPILDDLRQDDPDETIRERAHVALDDFRRVVPEPRSTDPIPTVVDWSRLPGFRHLA